MESLHFVKRIVFLTIFGAATLTLLTGCNSPTTLTREPAVAMPSEHVAEKNYRIGEPKVVNVGEAMVKFQDFWVNRIEKSAMKIDRTVRLTGANVDVLVEAGRPYLIAGRIVDNGKAFTALQLGTGNTFALVDQEGYLHNRIAFTLQAGLMAGQLMILNKELTLSEPNARMVRDVEVTIDQNAGYENFELLYTGTNSAGMNITYREFSPEGLARVAFYQNLTYSVNSETVTFKNYKISIHDANSESIRFTVIQD